MSSSGVELVDEVDAVCSTLTSTLSERGTLATSSFPSNTVLLTGEGNPHVTGCYSSMSINPQVTQWIKTTYPKPDIDNEWLEQCLNYVHGELNIPPNPFQPLREALEHQILSSELADSTVPGTGLPRNVSRMNDVVIDGPHILVQIVALTEIGSSAFQLLQVHKAREEFEMGGIVGLDGEEDEVDGARGKPKYPRNMLRFKLSDGYIEADAIEYRSLPGLELGETPLGYKMLLKNPMIRAGILWLEPGNVSLLGGMVEDREADQDSIFLAGLRKGLGWGSSDKTFTATDTYFHSLPPPALQVPPHRERTPFMEISPPPSPPLDPHEDDVEAPRRRKIPVPAPSPPSATVTSSTSSYFKEGSVLSADAKVLARERILPQTSGGLGMGTILVPTSPSPPPPAQRERPRERGRQIASLPRRSLVPALELPATKDLDAGSDYDFPEDDIDEAALQALDRMEAASLPNTNPKPAPGPSRITSANPPGPDLSQPRNSNSDIIILSDNDDDEEDKENVPVLTRHVRPRTQGGMQVDDDVIDISD